MKKNITTEKGPAAPVNTKSGLETMRHGDDFFPCAPYLDVYQTAHDFYPWHWHSELEISYVVSGCVRASVNEQQYLLRSGDGIFLNQRVLHSYSGGGKQQTQMPNILFHPSLIYGTQDTVYWEKYVKPLTLSPDFSHMVLRGDVPWQAEILDRARQAFSFLTGEPFGYEFYVRGALSEVLLLMAQKIPAATKQPAKNQAENVRVRQMLSYIQLHYTEPLQVQEIADSASVSRRECLRTFRRVTGSSPMQYVIDLRLRKARQLLAETDLPLLEICGLCGFQSQSYFTKLFHQRTGSSPGKYRNSGNNSAS